MFVRRIFRPESASSPSPPMSVSAQTHLRTLGRVILSGVGNDEETLNKRPRKLAVLVYLLLAQRPVARERLLDLFWGAHEDSRARHSLSDALSHIRKVLGRDAIIGSPEGTLMIDPAHAPRLDVDELAARVEAGDWAAAVKLYEGEFLAGIEVEDSPAFEEWVERERTAARRLFARACSRRCEELASRGQWLEAAAVASRWSAEIPESPEAARFLSRARAAASAPAHRQTPTDGAALQLLRDRWRRTATGSRQVVSITDAAAASTVDGFLQEVAATRGAVARVQAFATESRRPLQLLADLTRALIELPGIAAASSESLHSLAGLVPEIVDRFPGLPSKSGRVSPCQALRDLISAVTYESPLLVVITDGHHTDAGSIQCLADALLPLRDDPVMVVLTSLKPPEARSPVTTLLERLRSDAPGDTTSVGPTRRGRGVRERSWTIGALAAGVTVLVAGTLLLGAPEQSGVLAVGWVHDRTAGRAAAAAVLPELLATGLARVPGLRVMSHPRVLEGLAAIASVPDSQARWASAARAVGATSVVQGAVYEQGEELRLELWEVDLASGEVRGSFALIGTDLFSLADSAVAVFASARRLSPPASPLRTVTSTSLSARRLVIEGLRAQRAAEHDRAIALFDAAVREDSTYAMAAHLAAVMRDKPHTEESERAIRLAGRASDRERLHIQAHWLVATDDPRGHALADSFVARFPDDPAAHLIHAHSLSQRGEFHRAWRAFEHVVALDSIGMTGQSPVCHACDALSQQRMNALAIGDYDVAERAAQRRAAVPGRGERGVAIDWMDRLVIRARRGDFDAARRALDSAMRAYPGVDIAHATFLLAAYEGNFSAAESLVVARLRGAGIDERRALHRYLASARRWQGRLDDAASSADAVRVLSDSIGHTQTSLALAIVESQRAPRRAAALFSELAGKPSEATRTPKGSRWHAWMLAHQGASLWRAGDTAALPQLADSIQRVGARSGYARDRRLHHYVRGLLHASRGQHAAAVEAFERAIFSRYETYLAIPLGRSQLAIGRAADAASTAQMALQGPLDSQNQYESRTELHELLADALTVQGRTAEAKRHYAIVARAWSNADRQFQARAARAAARAGLN